MATRLYGINPNQNLENVTEGVGAAAATAVALTVDLSTSLVTEGTSTRAITKAEVVEALEYITQYIIRGNWPPA